MIPNDEKTIQHVGVADETIAMSIDQASLAHVMSVLTDLYSDPIAAVVREYSTNARDSHVDAGSSAPIQVRKPSKLSPTFEVQDFGIGMSVDDLRDTFSLYGRSTKRQSDDVTGLLGLGCKSGLTYANSFNVTAVKGGVKTFAVVTKDEFGVGAIKVLDTVGVNEPNGVTISVPVDPWQVDEFQTTIDEFFQYWERGTVLVDGAEPTPLTEEPRLMRLSEDVFLDPQGSSGDSVVVMGGVAYPAQGLPYTGHFSTIAFVPMGSVNFTPSREQLHLTDRTKDTISTLAAYVESTLPKVVASQAQGLSPLDQIEFFIAWASAVKGTRSLLEERFGRGIKGSSSIWTYTPTAHKRYGAKRAGANDASYIPWSTAVDWAKRDKVTWVTGYEFLTVSNLVKDRIVEYGANNSLGEYGRMFVLVPTGTDLSIIADKLSSVVRWEDIVEATTHVVERTKKKAGPTLYTVYRSGGYSDSLAAPLVSETAVLYTTSEDTARRVTSQHPGTVCAFLRSTQVDKFVRLHPTARDAYEYHHEQVRTQQALVTHNDKLLNSLTDFDKALASLGDRVIDPDIKRLAKVIDEGYSTAARQLLGWGIQLSTIEVEPQLQVRYTLLASFGYNARRYIGDNADDAVLYINSKYPSIQASAATTNEGTN